MIVTDKHFIQMNEKKWRVIFLCLLIRAFGEMCALLANQFTWKVLVKFLENGYLNMLEKIPRQVKLI